MLPHQVTMDYLVRRYVVAAGDEAAVDTALLAAGFTAYSFATRPDGRLDLTCYGANGRLPSAVTAICEGFPGELAEEATLPEAELVAGADAMASFELRPGVWVVPGDEPAPTGTVVLQVPPTAAFGDGRHPTTRMAAALFEPADVIGKRVLDLGCGSGLLGILAHRWGAAHLAFSDIDPASVRAAAVLAEAHGVAARRTVVSDLLAELADEPVDVVLANLYGDLCLRMLADERLTAILPHGLLVLSGIAHQRLAAVRAALAARGFRIERELDDGWWHALRTRR